MLEVPTSNLFFQFFQLFFRLLQDHMILYLTKLLLCFQVTSRRTKTSLKPFHIFTPETNKYSSEKVVLIVYLFSELQNSNKKKKTKWGIFNKKMRITKDEMGLWKMKTMFNWKHTLTICNSVPGLFLFNLSHLMHSLTTFLWLFAFATCLGNMPSSFFIFAKQPENIINYVRVCFWLLTIFTERSTWDIW